MNPIAVTLTADSSALVRGLEDAQIACSSEACRRMSRYGFHREALVFSDFERHLARVERILREPAAPIP